MRRIAHLFAPTLLVAAVFTSSYALADGPVQKESSARFEEGVQFAKTGKYEEARAKFLQSLALEKNAKTLLNLTIAEKNSGHPVEAIRHLRAYLADPDANKDKREDLRTKLLPELYTQTAHLRISAPSDWRITIDGEQVMYSKDDYDVTAGDHLVDASATGGTSKPRVITTKLGETSLVEFSAPAGTESPNANDPHHYSPPPPSHPFFTPRRIIGLSVAAVGLGVGIIGFVGFHGAASSDEDALAPYMKVPGFASNCVGSGSAECATRADLASSRASNENLATATLLIGGALFVGGLVVALAPLDGDESKWPDGRAQARIRIRPEGGTNYGGLRLSGGF